MLTTHLTKRIYLWAIPLCILALYGIFLMHKVGLVTADLGRHIQNGMLLFHDMSVLSTNYYSYTHPNFPVLNHHWGSGVVFFVLWKLFGFAGLQLFFIALSLLTLWLILRAVKFDKRWGLVGLCALPAIFLMAQRTEIRPEAFSYFFAALFFFVIRRFRTAPYNQSYLGFLYALPFIEIIWANVHIYFVLGPIVIGTFLVESLFSHRGISKKLLYVLIGTVVASLITPFGIKGILEVFTIFNNYGYMLAENQSVWFLEKFPGLHLNLNLFKFGFWLTALSFFVPLFRKKWKEIEVSNVLFFVGFGGMAWLAERNFALFGFFMIPVLVSNLSGFFDSLESVEKKVLNAIATGALLLIICIALFSTLTRYFPYWREGGLGLQTQNSLSMDFWKNEQLQGPIFNNYDVGGYLIYHLYPQEKVFVDNRPEAYPASFFQETYIPMQEDDSVWNEQLALYNFNAIVFSYHDMTPWGQQFLVARTHDPLWVPVFVDGEVLILLKHNEVNKSIIEKFALNLF